MAKDTDNDDLSLDGNPRLNDAAYRSLDLDADKYLGEISEFGLTDEQAHVLLQTLWDIMKGFVQLGFDVELCGKLLAEFNSATVDGQIHGNIAHSKTMEFFEDASETEDS